VLGASDPYETVTQFRVTPIVGLVSHQADFVADPREVDAIFEVPFAFFMDPANHQRHSRDYNGQTRYYYAMPYGDHYVWGATAGMLRALYLRVFAEG
ncbi:MAG: NUDIX hydrolase, partial [Hyphomonadaceae bacterium]